MPRILVYSHDTFGLGNIRRMLRISEALVERDPNSSVLLITGSPMLHAFRLPPHIDYVKLPCLARDVEGNYGVKHLDMEFAHAVRMRSSLILTAASDFDPDIILIDKKPMGVAGELASMLELFANRPNRPQIHLLLRDILDTAQATRKVWEANDYHTAIAKHYDGVLVVGEPHIFDLAEVYQFPAETRAKLHYCGYIDRARKAHRAIPELAVGVRQKVLIHAGGGQDGVALIEAAIGALELAGKDRDFDCHIIGGPEMNGVLRQKLCDAAGQIGGVQWSDFSDNMGEEIARSQLVVAMGGYNSVCEILSYRKRSIIVPRSRPVREQRIRAEAMEQHGLLKMIPEERLTPKLLLQEIERELAMSNVCSRELARLSFRGLDQICDLLLPSDTPTANIMRMSGVHS
jgi:predicted glycosyltransferase